MPTKRVTSFDVAKRAGVSRSVVSAVLNDTPGIGVSREKREAVLQAIRELNYHVDARASGMKTGKSFCIAAFGDTRNPLFLQVLEGIQRACAEYGFHILLSGDPGKNLSKLADLYFQRRIDGIISLDSVNYADGEWMKERENAKIPFVSIEGYAEQCEVVSILVDYGQSVQQALNYMNKSTCLKPVYVIFKHPEETENWAERDRREAYLAWCRQSGIPPVVRFLTMGEEEEGVLQLLKELTSDDPSVVPAILINWSIGVTTIYRKAHELKLRIGVDVLIMSADNTLRNNQSMVPMLSVMEIPYVHMGEMAVHALNEQIKQESVQSAPTKLWVKAELKPGESS
ncbi:LacI family DNA-binding transcriptional regulator [Paenibacillus sp. SI8]|uniref:LacI family DNA-binding transcriptional regulator n=1 Tax=unclassified Paenibacillus TaxID=185978 RepID=UPI0034658970